MQSLYGNKKNTLILMGFSILFGISFNFLFYQHRFGVNYPIYLAMLLIGTYWALRFQDKQFDRMIFAALSAVMMMLALPYMLFTNEAILIIDFLAVPILYFLAILFSLNVKGNSFVNFFVYIFVPITNMDKFVRSGSGLLRLQNKEKGNLIGRILLGIVFAALALIIIIPLMMSGDEAFSVLFRKVFDFEISVDLVFETILFVIVTLYSYGVIYFIYHKDSKSDQEVKLYQPGITPLPKTQRDYNGFVHTLLTFLFVIGAAYLVFSLVQIFYLFAKITVGLPDDFSYAEYARSGFFQVWALTIINVGIIMVCEHLSKKITAIKGKVFHILFTGYVVLNFIMTTSAFYKMMMYEDVYGLTRLRFLVMCYLVFQIIILITLLIKIWVKNFRFVRVTFIFAMVALIALNYVNMDNIIAKRNIARYENSGTIVDVYYLLNDLSADSYETVYTFVSELEDTDYEILYESYYDRANKDWRNNYVYNPSAEKMRSDVKADLLKEHAQALSSDQEDWLDYNLTYQKIAQLPRP